MIQNVYELFKLYCSVIIGVYMIKDFLGNTFLEELVGYKEMPRGQGEKKMFVDEWNWRQTV